MKKIGLAILLVLSLAFIVYGLVWAGPFLVCDPVGPGPDQPTDYDVVMDGGAAIISPAQTVTGGVRIHYDVSGVSAGAHTANVKACKTDVVWGRLCSTAVPLAFTRPSAPVVPANIGLIP